MERMTVRNIKSRINLRIPPTLTGRIITGLNGYPRYWATVYLDCLKIDLADKTRGSYAAAIDQLYNQAHEISGSELALDEAITSADFPILHEFLTGFLNAINNRTALDGIDRGKVWTAYPVRSGAHNM